MNLRRSNVVDCPACGATCLPKFAVYEENERLRAEEAEWSQHSADMVGLVRDVAAERDRVKRELLKFADWLERDRREPDKVLCAVQSMRRAAR